MALEAEVDEGRRLEGAALNNNEGYDYRYEYGRLSFENGSSVFRRR